MTSEVGSGQVAIFPVFKGFRKAVATEVDGAADEASRGFRKRLGKTGAEAGADTGKGFRSAFRTASSGTTEALVKSMTADVAKASKVVSDARLKEQDAAGRVRVAESQLAEVRKRYAADSSQVVRAQERLESAQRKLVAAQDVTKISSDKLRTAQKQLADATDEASQRTERAGGFMGRAFGGLRNVVAGVGDGISGAFRSSMQFVRQVGVDAANAVASAFKVAGLSIAAVVGTALVGGFGRLQTIELARARMLGLGLAAEEVGKALDIANAAAQGTAFGMDELADAASMALVAGVKAGPDLVNYLESIKGAATASGVSVAEIGRVFGNVRTEGRAYTGEIRQLADRQIPIWQALAEEIGAPVDQVRKLATEGKITADVFEAAVRRATGGMAAAMADTTQTAHTNMRAAMKRFGIALMGSRVEAGEIVGGLYPIFKDLFNTIKLGFDAASAAVLPFAEKFSGAISGKVLPFLERLRDVFQSVKDRFAEGFKMPDMSGLTDLLPILAPLIGALVGSIGPLLAKLPLIGGAFAGITGPLGLVVGAIAGLIAVSPELRDALGKLFDTIGATLGDLMTRLAPVFEKLMADLMPILKEIGAVLGEAIVAALPVLVLLGEAVGMILEAAAPLIPKLLELVAPILRLIEPIAELLEKLLPPLIDILEAILPYAIAILVGALDILIGVIEGLVGWVDGAFEMLGLFIDLLSGDISHKEFIEKVMSISGPFGEFIRWVGDAATQFGSFVGDVINNARNFAQGVKDKVGEVVGFFTGIPGRIKAALVGARDWLVQTGRDIVDGLIAGVRGMIDRAVKAVTDIGGAMLNGVKDFLGIKSPSRRFRVEVGQEAGAGVVMGLEDSMPAISAAAKRLVSIPDVVAPKVSVATSGDAAAVAERGVGLQGVRDVNLINPDPHVLLELFNQRFGARLQVGDTG